MQVNYAFSGKSSFYFYAILHRKFKQFSIVVQTLIKQLAIRSFQATDESDVIDLWHRCHLVVPQNDPHKDIEMKLQVQPELFLVGMISNRIVSTVMSGYDGHRGWIYYLAVDPDFRQNGIGRRMVEKTEKKLRQLGCPKINLQVRNSNKSVIAFYQHIGFLDDDVLGMGKRL